jgi:error-prone DNA polymerase
MYIELHAASAFSFLQGASLPETLVERAAALGYPALALLDADGVYGAPRFHKAATQAGLKAIIGAELTIESSRHLQKTTHRGTETPRNSLIDPRCLGASMGRDLRAAWRLPVLVASAEGYRNLCRLVTRMKMRAAKGQGALALEEFEGFTTGLVALAGRPVLDAHHYGVGGLLDRLVGLFGRSGVCV